jgi:hypothetical protein
MNMLFFSPNFTVLFQSKSKAIKNQPYQIIRDCCFFYSFLKLDIIRIKFSWFDKKMFLIIRDRKEKKKTKQKNCYTSYGLKKNKLVVIIIYHILVRAGSH